VEIDSHLHDPTQRIDLRLEELLMHAAQFQDECALEGSVGTPDAILDEPDAIPVSEIGKWGRTAAPEVGPKGSPRTSRRGLLLLGAAATIALTAGAWLLRPHSVGVDIRSSPTGAAVSLDGAAQGRTPLRLKLPGPPKGRVSLELPGHQVQHRELSAGDRSLDVALQVLTPAPVAESPREPETPAPAQVKAAAPRSQRPPRPESKASQKKDIFDQLRKRED
jgi:hypothetical protein